MDRPEWISPHETANERFLSQGSNQQSAKRRIISTHAVCTGIMGAQMNNHRWSWTDQKSKHCP